MPAKDSGTGTAIRLASWLRMESTMVVQGNNQWQLAGSRVNKFQINYFIGIFIFNK